MVGATPTPYGGKWAHEDAAPLRHHRGRRRSSTTALVSQSALEVDVLNDPEVIARFTEALRSLTAFQPAA